MLQVVLVLHALYYLPVTGYLIWIVPQLATMMSTEPSGAAQIVIGFVVAATIGVGSPLLVLTAIRLRQGPKRAWVMIRACSVVIGIHLVGSLVLLVNSGGDSLGALALAGGCPVFVIIEVLILIEPEVRRWLREGNATTSST
ncbi:hypothetical protein [Glycomyces niveus]|uniref:Uncharacterized protein n=1 Tax=Glycomyces niveus TaxID=2820287 RepID=A0ABS3U4L1_9ACTN|nr:hypothetical protein [Glycomyces sp. NEAU-S30]MBO3733714.1 hypothetical protein [Glycomyces sp. NEAU-S30]